MPRISRDSIRPAIESDWRVWLTTLFPDFASAPFAPHHELLWRWVWEIERGVRPPPFVAILARGGAKSTSAEMATVAVGARGTRRYGLYISETQDQADAHVQSIGELLETPGAGHYYPALASRAVNKYGSSRGWRRNRLSTAAGFTVDAIGFDTAARGIKLGALRPDFLVLDDIDNQKDTPERVDRKIGTLTRGLLPVGANDVAVLAVQNLIHRDSIFARLADRRADFLAARTVVGPIPAVAGLTIEKRDGRDFITGGVPTWAGQSLATAQAQIDEWGLTAFLVEAQHEVALLAEHIYDPAWWTGVNRYDPDDEQAARAIKRRWLTFDTAMKDGEQNDYTACGLWEMRADYRVRFRPLWQRKLQFPAMTAAIIETASVYQDTLVACIIEDRASGTSAIQVLRGAAPSWLSRRIESFLPAGSKTERARTGTTWCERGYVLLPTPSPSVPELQTFEDTIYRFPDVLHDDYADTFSMGVIGFIDWFQRAYGARGGMSGVPE